MSSLSLKSFRRNSPDFAQKKAAIRDAVKTLQGTELTVLRIATVAVRKLHAKGFDATPGSLFLFIRELSDRDRTEIGLPP